MPGNVRNASDEKKWSAAKKQATEQYGFEKPAKDRYYAIVETIYKAMKGESTGAVADALDEIAARLSQVNATTFNVGDHVEYIGNPVMSQMTGLRFGQQGQIVAAPSDPAKRLWKVKWDDGRTVGVTSKEMAPIDDQSIPDDTALDEQLFRQKWEGAVAHFEVTAASPNKDEIVKALQEIKKQFSRFGELHWNDVQQFLGQKSQKLVDSVEALNDVIKTLGGGAAQKLTTTPTAPKKDFGVGPKPEMEFSPQASLKK